MVAPLTAARANGAAWGVLPGSMQQDNAVSAALKRDDVALGANVETGLPRLVEIYGDLGFDWVWVHTEHENVSGFDAE